MAEVKDLGESRVLHAMVKDIHPMLVEDVGWAQDCYHVEEGILVLENRAGIGRDPDRKWRAGAGVWGCRAWSLCRVILLCRDNTFISAGESRREARPLNSLGAE